MDRRDAIEREAAKRLLFAILFMDIDDLRSSTTAGAYIGISLKDVQIASNLFTQAGYGC
jgi:hypothetical protein